jgi:WD40 repeat protein
MLTPRWPLLPGPDAAKLVELDTGDDKLTCVAVDPAGAWTATGATGGTVRLWNPQTGEQLMRLDTGDDVEALAAAPDGSLVAAVNRHGVHVWDVPSGRLLHRLAPSKHLTGCAFSAGNRWLVAWDTAAVRRWDLTAPKPTRSLHTMPTVEERPLPRQAVTAVSAGGTLVAAHDGHQLIRVWEIGTLELVATLDLGEPAVMLGLTFTSGDRSLIVAQPRKVRILRVADGAEEHQVPIVQMPVPFAGDLLLEHTWVGFTLHNRRGVPVLSVPGGRSRIAGIAATPDDRLLVCAHEGGTAVVWDGDALRRLVEDDRSGRVYQCLPAPGADWFLTTHLNRTVVRSMADASTLHTLSEEHLHSADIAPDKSWVAVASHRELTVFDTGTWQALATAPGKFGTLCRITPDGRTVIGIGGTALTTWTRPGPDVHGMALADTENTTGALVAPDGTWVAHAVVAGVRIFGLPLTFGGTTLDSATGIRVGPIRRGRPRVAPPGEIVTSIACTVDSRLILAASRSGTLHIWRTAAFRPKPASVRVHDGSFRMVIDPVGRWVATFGDDRRLCFLPTRNLQYGGTPGVVTGTDHDVRAAAASPDGTRIATADTDGTLRVLTAPAARGETPVLLAKLTVQARPDALTWTADGIFTAGPYGTELFEVSP